MGTLATFFRKSEFFPAADFFSATGTTETREEKRAIAQAKKRAATDQFRLRALPNDDVYFYVKRIDNSRVVRQADPQTKGQCWSAIGATCVLALLAGSVAAPKLGSLLAGYKIQQLRAEAATLQEEKRSLEVDEATLMSPARLDELAAKQKLNRPGAGQVMHLQPRADGAFASVVMPTELKAR